VRGQAFNQTIHHHYLMDGWMMWGCGKYGASKHVRNKLIQCVMSVLIPAAAGFFYFVDR
jgi:hypothetical protein